MENKNVYEKTVDKSLIKNVIILLSVVTLNVILFTIIMNKFELFYAINDDVAMTKLANGEYCGLPCPYLIFILYPIGFLLSSLYNISRYIPWYGLFQIGAIFFSLTLILYKIIKNIKKMLSIVIAIACYIIVFIQFIMANIVEAQFTVTAAIICVSLLVLVATLDDKSSKKIVAIDIILCCTLSIFGISMRRDIFLVYLPMYCIVLITSAYCKQLTKRKCIMFLSIIILCSGGAYLIDQIKTNSYVGYKEFNDFCTSRSDIFDYGDMPNYDENKEFYEKLGVSRAEVNVISSYSLDLGENLSNSTMRAIADKAIADRKKISKKKMFIEKWMECKDTRSFKIFFFLVILLIILSFVYTKYRNHIFAVAGIIAYYNIIAMLYLIIKGRIVDRVTNSLSLSMLFIAFLCAAILIDKMNMKNYIFNREDRNLIDKILNLGILLFVLVICINSIVLYKSLQEDVKGKGIALQWQNAIIEYMKSKPDNYYYIDSSTMFAEVGRLLEKTDNRINNFSSLGGWTCRSPQYYYKISKYGITSGIDALCTKSNVYFVSNKFPSYLEDYVDEKYSNKKLIGIDKLVINGYSYTIYKVELKSQMQKNEYK